MTTVTTRDYVLSQSFRQPRGGRVAAELFSRFFRWLTTPAAPRAKTRGEEAAYVRELAYRIQNTDPGFAADLFAAASRHEGGE
jgi:hypothetical protein